MDARLERLLSQQRAAHFAGLAGTEVHATIRLSDQFLNQAIAAFLPPEAVVRSVMVHAHEGNWLDVKLALARPAFLPPIPVELTIERQPELAADALLVLRVTGGAGALLRLAGPAIARMGGLPAGIRLDGERIIVDLRALLAERGHGDVLEYATDLNVATEEAGVAMLVTVRVR